MNKKSFALVLSIFLVLALFTGCVSQTPGTGQSSQTTLTSQTTQGTSAAPKVTEVILATTTSTQDSGLLDYLLPVFEKQTGYKVKTIAVGSGQALEMGKRGEADVLLTHAPSSEKPLVDNKDVTNYQLVMHNDFIIVGPSNDPAGIKNIKSSADAFKAIAAKKAVFISRGDKSGTNTKELAIWKAAAITKPSGTWYQESGQGMGATLKIASDKAAYTLTDRATYLTQKATLKLDILNQGSKDLLNIYHVMQVSPDKYTKVNAAGAKAFVDFMVNPDTQKLIGEFGKDKFGEQLFFPDAGKDESTL